MGMKVNGSTGLTFPDNTTMSTGSQAVRAWVNFNGTGTVAIRASYNVTSITDNGTGNYTVNFTTAMPDANYAATVTAGGTLNTFISTTQEQSVTRTASLFGVLSVNQSGSAADVAQFSCAIFR